MSSKKSFYLSLLLTHAWVHSATITVQITPYPDNKTVHTLKKPDELAKHTLKKIAKNTHSTGLFATYAGFLEASNPDGYIIFPRKHNKPSLNLLVTQRITPIIMFEQTIQHWQLIPDEQAALYTIQRQTDPDTQLIYWDVAPAELPKDSVIPLETLIIIAQPEHIYVPTGITLTTDSPNLVLPPLYTRKELKSVDNSLYILTMAHLFGPVHVTQEKKERYYSQQPQEQ